MQFVDKPTFWPAKCAITGNSEDHDGFIDTGNELVPSASHDTRIYLSVGGVKRAAEFLGWKSPQTVEQLESRITELESDNEHLQTENEKAKEVYASIESLENHGFEIKVAA